MRRCIVLASVLGVMVTTAVSVDKIDTGKSAEYVSGPWRYRYTIRAVGSRSEGRHGVLLYNGRSVEVISKAGLNDRIRTPWGMMQFLGPKQRRFGSSGWLTKRAYDRPFDIRKGKLLPPPKAKPLARGERQGANQDVRGDLRRRPALGGWTGRPRRPGHGPEVDGKPHTESRVGPAARRRQARLRRDPPTVGARPCVQGHTETAC